MNKLVSIVLFPLLLMFNNIHNKNVVGARIQLLEGCQTEGLGSWPAVSWKTSSVPHHASLSIAQLASTEQASKKTRQDNMEGRFFILLISEVISHHFCSTCFQKNSELYKSVNTRKGNHWGHLGGYPPQALNNE